MNVSSTRILGPHDQWAFAQDWNGDMLDLPPKFLISAALLTAILLGEAAGEVVLNDGLFIGGILRLPQHDHVGVWKITSWDHALGALNCEWPD